ncbi:MAG TPA: hypothetical protein VIG47_11130, partial [Gemmatimonadaceae bacterium]
MYDTKGMRGPSLVATALLLAGCASTGQNTNANASANASATTATAATQSAGTGGMVEANSTDS